MREYQTERPYYRAYCAHCGRTERYDYESTKLLSPFFLPDRCQGCHSPMSSSDFNNDDWIIEFGYCRRQKHDIVWWNPLTWLNPNPWGWVEWDDSPTTREART